MAERQHRQGSGRHLRVGEEMRHALAEILARGEVHDPAVEGASITITEVRVTPDLRHAKVFFVPLGDADAQAILPGLQRSARFLRGQLAQRVRLKFMPTVSFARDESFEYASRIDALMRKPEVRRDLTPFSSGERDENR